MVVALIRPEAAFEGYTCCAPASRPASSTPRPASSTLRVVSAYKNLARVECDFRRPGK